LANLASNSTLARTAMPTSTLRKKKLEDAAYQWETKESFERRFRDRVTSSLNQVERNCTEALKNSKYGTFVYPGNGQLKFKNPIFNYNGDLLAEVEHLSVDRGEIIVPESLHTTNKLATNRRATNTLTANGRIKIPGLEQVMIKIKQVSGGGPNPYSTPNRIDPLQPKLEWVSPENGISEIKEATLDTKPVTITATNTSKATVNLKYFTVSVISGPDKRKLFTADKFVAGPPPKTASKEIIGYITVSDTPTNSLRLAKVDISQTSGQKHQWNFRVTNVSTNHLLTFAPGSQVQLKFQAPTGLPNPYNVNIHEEWTEDNATSPGYKDIVRTVQLVGEVRDI